MKITTMIKDVDDFGREQINGNLYRYSQHYPRVEKDDIILYFFPKNRAVGIYEVKEETEFYSKDGFQFCSGKMIRFNGEAHEFVSSHKNQEIAKKVETEILRVVKEYFDK